MTFPNSPFGQGFPDQAGQQQPLYTQQPGFPPILSHQQPAGYPGGQPGAPQSGEPSGATGMIAAVLAALGAVAGIGTGALAAIGIGVNFTSSNPSGQLFAVLIVSVLVNSSFGMMCAIGAVRLRERQMRGRWLVVGACAMAIPSMLMIYIVTAADASSYGAARGVFLVVGLVFPIATLVLALLPSTAAWIEAKQKPVAPQPHPPYPGW